MSTVETSPLPATRFALPTAFDDGDGRTIEHGVMRRAEPASEIDAIRDFRVFLDPANFVPVLLSKVLRFDRIGAVSPELLSRLPESHLKHLERLYRELNDYPTEERGEAR